LIRQVARNGSDPQLDEITLTLPERLGLRRIELGRMRINDISYTNEVLLRRPPSTGFPVRPPPGRPM
jgi:hypothetical protein